MKVLIENSGSFTSAKNAEHYIRQGRARWIKAAKPTIRFIEADHRHRLVMKHAGDLYSAGRDGLARQDQARRIPTVGDVRRLYTIGFAANWAWTAAVFNKPMQNISNNEPPAVRMQVARSRYAR